MSAPIHRINPTLRLIKCTSFDSIIDVRSPSEFREDHMPNLFQDLEVSMLLGLELVLE